MVELRCIQMDNTKLHDSFEWEHSIDRVRLQMQRAKTEQGHMNLAQLFMQCNLMQQGTVLTN